MTLGFRLLLLSPWRAGGGGGCEVGGQIHTPRKNIHNYTAFIQAASMRRIRTLHRDRHWRLKDTVDMRGVAQSCLVITTLWNHFGSLRDAEDVSKAAVASRWPHLPHTLNTEPLILILRADQMSATFINTTKPIWRWTGIRTAQINDDVKHRFTNLSPKHTASNYVYTTSCYVISDLFLHPYAHFSSTSHVCC
jgi:hypothetical protein